MNTIDPKKLKKGKTILICGRDLASVYSNWSKRYPNVCTVQTHKGAQKLICHLSDLSFPEEPKQYLHLEKSRSRGYWRLLHAQTNTLVATVKGKEEAIALCKRLETLCDLNFTQEDIEQGTYPAKEMLAIIQPVIDSQLKEVLARRSK